MFERISLKLGEGFLALKDGQEFLTLKLKREDGQGATEYAMVIGFLIILLVAGLGVLGVSIGKFLDRVAAKVDGMVP
jgi:Flp pilus assembly pilin Flp